ncbi:MAG: hypothetical protein V9G14_11205 [Cypionkella sp.]
MRCGAYEIATSDEERRGGDLRHAARKSKSPWRPRRQLDKAGTPHARGLGAVDGAFRAADAKAYREAKLLGTEKTRIAIEAGVRTGWDRFIGADGEPSSA